MILASLWIEDSSCAAGGACGVDGSSVRCSSFPPPWTEGAGTDREAMAVSMVYSAGVNLRFVFCVSGDSRAEKIHLVGTADQ